jgi:hypothetical protein
MTFEQIRAFIYELKMDVAYNRNDFLQLDVISDKAKPMIDRLNDELASGYWAHTENYDILCGYKCDLIQIQKNCMDLMLKLFNRNEKKYEVLVSRLSDSK